LGAGNRKNNSAKNPSQPIEFLSEDNNSDFAIS
jgi:hypothetical protein